jgi:hypothetical protein
VLRRRRFFSLGAGLPSLGAGLLSLGAGLVSFAAGLFSLGAGLVSFAASLVSATAGCLDADFISPAGGLGLCSTAVGLAGSPAAALLGASMEAGFAVRRRLIVRS